MASPRRPGRFTSATATRPFATPGTSGSGRWRRCVVGSAACSTTLLERCAAGTCGGRARYPLRRELRASPRSGSAILRTRVDDVHPPVDVHRFQTASRRTTSCSSARFRGTSASRSRSRRALRGDRDRRRGAGPDLERLSELHSSAGALRRPRRTPSWRGCRPRPRARSCRTSRSSGSPPSKLRRPAGRSSQWWPEGRPDRARRRDRRARFPATPTRSPRPCARSTSTASRSARSGQRRAVLGRALQGRDSARGGEARETPRPIATGLEQAPLRPPPAKAGTSATGP